MDRQKVELVGRAVASPELQKSKDNNSYAKISVAVNWKSKDPEGNETEEVTYYEVLVFNKRAEKSTNIEKGTPLRVTGDLQIKPYLSKDGEAKVSATVIARDLQILDYSIFR